MHECEDCGETFDTLTERRLHECDGESGSSAVGAEYGEELAAFRDRIEDGEFDALYGALATFEDAQAAAHETDADAYRDLFWEYFEPFADGLDRFAVAEGWPVLAEFVEAYDPDGGTFPHVSAVIENAVGRFVIRTRLEGGVEAIPADALAYLRSVPPACPSGADAAFEEATTYGWGIGHPEEPVADRLRGMAEEHRFWVSAALEAALHADQEAAVDLLARIVTDDDVSFTVPHSRLTVDAARFFLDAVVGPDVGRDPAVPRYWDRREYGDAFAWDPEVKARVRELVRETGVADDLPEEWTLADLGI
jgi:hypothetical protein